MAASESRTADDRRISCPALEGGSIPNVLRLLTSTILRQPRFEILQRTDANQHMSDVPHSAQFRVAIP
ncbi:hypothetical protein Cob_v005710 [Colletotrichum orbiculare MAFF 240422]|uniref:Uncharacterized protein n=1 Tax=Colletotrichum orbiculare (strain 104-T / ATCC 96160 / CBS 514.97 / LARS 414 / MAFF 240422) TaxID=1213857 RepID=A0A484FTL4_COLOR|nr:hypothetical protein Cob_v005710 [Colletotrichum orbiculare MAFF 240422]